MRESLRREFHSLRRLWPLMAVYWWQIGLFLAMGVLASLAEGVGTAMMIPLLQGETVMAQAGGVLRWINRLAGTFPAERRTAAIIGLILATVLLKAILAYAYTNLAVWIKGRTLHQMRTRMFRRLLAAPQSYLDTQQGGVLLHTLGGGAEQTAQSVLTTLWLLLNICTITVFSALLMAIAWQLTLAVVATLLVLSRLVSLATRQVSALSQSGLKANQDLSQRLKESVFGLRTIHIFCRESYEDQRFAAASKHSKRLAMQREMLISLAHPLSEGLAAAVMIGLVFLALQAEFPLSVLVTMVFMLYRLQPQIQTANTNLTRLASMDAAVEAAMGMLNSPDNPSLGAGTRGFERLEHGIRFEQVTFIYGQKGRKVLREVDFEIAKGSTTAFVGPSGAGKSTLINLLCRFYDPSAGRLLVDGHDLAEFDLASWRSRIALVSQEVHLFSGTIRETIAYGKLDATEEDIVAAATRAHAHEFILQLPKGYDTPVGDNGKNLSGGQRQRLSIARAIVRDPEILILDEATNALDNLSEAYIRTSIEELGRNRTVILVAHRLSTIERADKIVVINQGLVVEQGRFEELLARDGLFSTLYHSDRNEPLSL